MYTHGFDSPIALTEHFGDHGLEFSATDEQHYLMLAITFAGVTASLWGSRMYQAIRRFSAIQSEYRRIRVLSASRFIRTYFKPDPLRQGAGSNLQYFLENRAR